MKCANPACGHEESDHKKFPNQKKRPCWLPKSDCPCGNFRREWRQKE